MFLISFSDNGHTFAGRSVALPVCVASDDPGDDLIADFKRQQMNNLPIRARTLGFVGALLIVGLAPLHLASRYFADPVVATLSLIAFCAVLGHVLADLQMLWAMPYRKYWRRPKIDFKGRKPEPSMYAALMAIYAVFIVIGPFDMVWGDIWPRAIAAVVFGLVGLEAALRALAALFHRV